MKSVEAMCLCLAILLSHGIVHAAGPPDTSTASARSARLILGALVGVPSGVAVTGGVVAEPLCVKVSGGYWGSDWNGVQGDVGWVFDSEGLLAQGIFVVGGTFRANPQLLNGQGELVRNIRQERYIGLAYGVDYAGFFLQAGLAKGMGDYPNPAVLLQAGYLITIP